MINYYFLSPAHNLCGFPFCVFSCFSWPFFLFIPTRSSRAVSWSRRRRDIRRRELPGSRAQDRTGNQTQGDLFAVAHEAHPAQGRASSLPEETQGQGLLDFHRGRGSGAGSRQGRNQVPYVPHSAPKPDVSVLKHGTINSLTDIQTAGRTKSAR